MQLTSASSRSSRVLPFRAFAQNEAWLDLVLLGADLVAWTKMLLLSGTYLASCEPKRFRYRLYHVVGRIVSHAWGVTLPLADALARAFATAHYPGGLLQRAPGIAGIGAIEPADPRKAVSAEGTALTWMRYHGSDAIPAPERGSRHLRERSRLD